MSNPRSASWCFTVNNYVAADIVKIQGILCDFLVYGIERAPTTGTPHLQGYVEFDVRKRRSTVASLFPHGTHFEAARGSLFQNVAYCTKDGDYWMSDAELLAAFQASASLTFPSEWLPEEVAEFRLGYNVDWTSEDVSVYMWAHSRYINFLLSLHPEKSRKKLVGEV